MTPFSPRALNRGLTGVLVSLLRLGDATFNENLAAGRLTAGHPRIDAVRRQIRRRAGLVTMRQDVELAVDQELGERIDEWLNQIQQIGAGARLGYKEVRDGQTLGLLKSAEGNVWDDFVCLNSLRDVEAGAPLLLDDSNMRPARRYEMPGAAAPEEEGDQNGE